MERVSGCPTWTRQEPPGTLVVDPREPRDRLRGDRSTSASSRSTRRGSHSCDRDDMQASGRAHGRRRLEAGLARHRIRSIAEDHLRSDRSSGGDGRSLFQTRRLGCTSLASACNSSVEHTSTRREVAVDPPLEMQRIYSRLICAIHVSAVGTDGEHVLRATVHVRPRATRAARALRSRPSLPPSTSSTRRRW